MSKKVKLKRVYDPPERGDGMRILVERLWPRGMKKEDLVLDVWLKEVAPSTELRRWFGHDPTKWKEFQLRYYAELDRNKSALAPILQALCKKTVTLLYSSKDQEHNSALCLKHYLEK